ncbi:unnamed protein product [Ambrosiozyma monospora]|uniref:Unnamed protein product n=1 Tax=Ambrosiozyma monospora TaxID=43982 RepID=A0ACB5TXQ8_AMBMO|nr:unnamed protein product [Ambrosiozyma monospora]
MEEDYRLRNLLGQLMATIWQMNEIIEDKDSEEDDDTPTTGFSPPLNPMSPTQQLRESPNVRESVTQIIELIKKSRHNDIFIPLLSLKAKEVRELSMVKNLLVEHVISKKLQIVIDKWYMIELSSPLNLTNFFTTDTKDKRVEFVRREECDLIFSSAFQTHSGRIKSSTASARESLIKIDLYIQELIDRDFREGWDDLHYLIIDGWCKLSNELKVE